MDSKRASRSPLLVESIVVPVDGSSLGGRALLVARSLSQATGAPIHAYSFSPAVGRPQFVDRIRGQVAEGLRGTPHSLVIRPAAEPVPAMVTGVLSRHEGALLCMPTHGNGRSAGITGSVASEVVAAANGPVLLIGPDCQANTFRPTAPVLVAIDPADSADVVDGLAASWANRFATEQIRIAVVVDDRETVSSSEIAETIVLEASDVGASVIAMTTHARRGLNRLWHGSVSALVARHAPCPVLVGSVARRRLPG